MSVQQISQAGHTSTGEVESLIWNICAEQHAHTDVLIPALKYHLSSGGQRTRASLSLACSKALGLSVADATALAATVECLHNASLVQDDLQDGSSLRRSKVPVWKRYGTDTALCLTDLLISAA